jgi:hypothetical protein
VQPDTISSAMLAGVKRRHRRGRTSNPRRDYCYADNQDWPCDSTRLVAAVEAALELCAEAQDWGRGNPEVLLFEQDVRRDITAALTGQEAGDG